MRKTVTSLAAFLAAFILSAQTPAVHDVDITVRLSGDGSALVTEVWDINWDKTEWYLVRDNLGDIVISDFKVRDENGLDFVNEGEWDVDRSLEQKAGKCGIVHKKNGCELCWGVGSGERHVFTTSYRMSNVVKALDDYDILHMQFVSQGIRPRPEHARIRLCAESADFTDGPVLVWSFGYKGTVGFADGDITAETNEAFLSDKESMILLVRFDKGMFAPMSVIGTDFESIKARAFKGSDYQSWLDQQESEGNSFKKLFAIIITIIFGAVYIGIMQARKRNKNMFGVIKLKEIGYERDIPFGGDLFESRYVLNKCREMNGEGQMASALILKMIKDGWIEVTSDGSRKVKLNFIDKDGSVPEGAAGTFYEMLRKAAGADDILEGREFSKWSSHHVEELNSWILGLNREGALRIQEHDYGKGTVFTPEGQKEARKVIGFRKYLKDFTLIDERGAKEVTLWQDYIIFAALYGIADKVAKQLKDIDPKAFETYIGYPYATYNTVINMSDRVGRTMVVAASGFQTSSSVGGHGGFSSFGGGGGFSGGGFGGGGR